MEIRQYPDPVLRQRAEAVVAFDQALAALAQEMIRTMHEASGLGLAANQIGLTQRIAIVAPDDEAGHEIALVNPQIVHAEEWEESDEGCLSFPGIYIKVGRFAQVRIRYQNLQGKTCEMEATSLLARAIQHELDHLDGRLLVDRMSSIQRMTHRRRLRELTDRFEKRTAEARERAEAGSKASR